MTGFEQGDQVVRRVWYRRKETAKYFGVSVRTVARWTEYLPEDAVLPLNSRSVLYRLDRVEQWLARTRGQRLTAGGKVWIC